MRYLCLERQGKQCWEVFYLDILQDLHFVLPGDRMLRSGGSVAAQLPRGQHVCGSAVWPSASAPPAAAALRRRSTCSPSPAIEKLPSCFSSCCLPLSVSILSLPMAGAPLSSSEHQPGAGGGESHVHPVHPFPWHTPASQVPDSSGLWHCGKHSCPGWVDVSHTESPSLTSHPSPIDCASSGSQAQLFDYIL